MDSILQLLETDGCSIYKNLPKLAPMVIVDDHDDDDNQFDSNENGRKIISACKLWEDMIGETVDESPVSSSPNLHLVSTTSEQNFQKQSLYELIEQERDLDPRSHFQQLTNIKRHSHSAAHYKHQHNHKSVRYTKGI
ncbi:hypothetical protein PSHT_04908 [Puccinia striiformis]|uniref:Uncharacterized protein n=1 Tax=Puccinia striiformis TaxID=27350 RepID=A0A2S4WBQ8_9BASI|nr:hypothetical protein PSHT_04908 [Puccinia striiformis]